MTLAPRHNATQLGSEKAFEDHLRRSFFFSQGTGTSRTFRNLSNARSENKTLFQIPGRGIPVGESITYNSQDSSTGPLGMGWHLGSDTSVTEKSDGSVIYMGSDGSVYQFTPAPDGKGGYDAQLGFISSWKRMLPATL